MKAAILSILLFFTANLPDGEADAQTIWYVDRDATGANTGRSWEDAWNTLDSSVWLGYQGVNWAIIGDGDTIYVSGGIDSTRYVPLSNNLYNGMRREISEGEIVPTFDETVIITKAWQSGHNGDVYFTPKDDNTYSIFLLAGGNNIKLTNVKIVETRSDNTTQVNGLVYIYGDRNTIENCLIYNRGLTTGAYLEGTNLTLKGNFFDYEQNALDNDIDPIGAAGSDGTGTLTIDGNIIIIRNTSATTSSHRDGIQIADVGDVSTNANTMDIVIRNNLLVVAGSGTSWNGMVYASGAKTNINWYIYNNIFVANNTSSNIGGLFMYQGFRPPDYPDWTPSVYAFNNTVIMSDDGTGLSMPIGIEDNDTLYFKNNITVMDAAILSYLRSTSFYEGVYYRRFDYNGYFEYGGLAGNFYTGEGFGNYTYSQWTNPANFVNGDVYDANSITGNSTDVIFAEKYGEDVADYYTETGRGLGINIGTDRPDLLAKFPDIVYDILGNPRGEAWDMGALEYVGNQSNNINVKGKIFLQGPFSQNLMSTTLNQSSLLPNSQPYNQPPWNYNGNESFNPGSNPTVVDWVLVELRSASSPSQIVSRRAALLKNDGLLLNTNGVEGIDFSNVDPGSYYIVIFHRNHLAIMSAAPVPLSSNSTLYDFTNAMNKAYGQNPMVELSTGKYGMYATDGNADGVVNYADRDDVWLIQNGIMGYLGGDFNMNSGVTVHDVNQLWNSNNGAETQVP